MTTQISPPKVDVIEQVIVCRSAASREELEKVNLSEAGVAMRSSLSEVASHDLHGPVKASNPCAFVRFSSSKHVWDIRKSLDFVVARAPLGLVWSLQPCCCIIAEWPDPYVAGAWTNDAAAM